MLGLPRHAEKMSFAFTVPGLFSPYALQASAFLKIQFHFGFSFLPDLHVLGYQPIKRKCHPQEPDRASLLVVLLSPKVPP